MTTPEGKVKKRIRSLLDSYKPGLYYYMPVPSGYGRTCIDYIGCANGRFFGIEAKSNVLQEPTERQLGVMDDIQDAGGAVFLINDEQSLDTFRAWLAIVIGPRR